jgi:ribosomal protein S18 acetylase RimI-like enzyme
MPPAAGTVTVTPVARTVAITPASRPAKEIMSNYRLPETPDIEKAYRAAHRALETIAPSGFSFVPEADLELSEVISQFPYMVEEAEMAVAIRLGPRISWTAEHQGAEWELTMACVDFDGSREYGFGAAVDDSGYDEWPGSALDRAARAYRRAAGWDFAPGEAGIWLLMLAPVEAIGGGEDSLRWHYSGHLAGFVILYDRDNDGTYEAVGHVWTAAAWRRQGIARRLLEEAKSRFHAAVIERPYTNDGTALVKAVRWPEAATP